MKRYIVIGDPVAHSLSPVMMRAAFAAAGLHAEYDTRRIASEAWPEAMVALHREGIAGGNVTVPHKEGALVGARTLTDTARAIGAVNTLVRNDDGWEGDNTDGPGFLDWVQAVGAGGLLEREALVLGAGGSARAIVWGLVSAGCPRVRLANRTEARAKELAKALEEALGVRERVACETPGWPAPIGGLVVNCTSLGLRPDDASPISADAVAPAGHYLDLVYTDPPGVRVAREAGVPAEGGLGLLVAQGARSFARWTGVSADTSAMREAVEAELARRRGPASEGRSC